MKKTLAITAITLSFTACSAPPSDETELALSPPAAKNANYLALGDSIAFGFNPNLKYAAPFAGFVGYPEEVASNEALVLANVACPGETSGSFSDATVPDNGCHSLDDYFSQGLKIDYAGVSDQMDYAIGFLKSHPATRLVTLDVGGNDLLLVQNACGSDLGCIAVQLPLTLAKFTANLTGILIRLRAVYSGRLILLTQYATNYQDVKQEAALVSLQQATQKVGALFDARVADGFSAFAWASLLHGGDTCAAGLLIVNPDGTCDKHPSVKGRGILANEVLKLVP
jgi:hypothetical protein